MARATPAAIKSSRIGDIEPPVVPPPGQSPPADSGRETSAPGFL